MFVEEGNQFSFKNGTNSRLHLQVFEDITPSTPRPSLESPIIHAAMGWHSNGNDKPGKPATKYVAIGIFVAGIIATIIIWNCKRVRAKKRAALEQEQEAAELQEAQAMANRIQQMVARRAALQTGRETTETGQANQAQQITSISDSMRNPPIYTEQLPLYSAVNANTEQHQSQPQASVTYPAPSPTSNRYHSPVTDQPLNRV